jgi:thiol-disulfide isomerase/thioredoxin
MLALGTVIALAAALGAAAIVHATSDSSTMPKPEVSLSFNGSDAEPGTEGLVGGDNTGDAAPSASFALLAGGSTSLTALKGTPIVVNFFASWCVPCVKEMPALESVHRALGDEVAFVGIDLRDSVSATQELVEKTKVSYQIGRDPSGGIFEAFDGVNMPSTYLIAADGTIADRHAGAQSADELRARIKKHLGL